MIARNSYQDKVVKSLKYINDHLGKTILWEDVSKACGISNYHFHRIFCAIMDETPGNYIKRKRLERAIMLLIYSSDFFNIAEIS